MQRVISPLTEAMLIGHHLHPVYHHENSSSKIEDHKTRRFLLYGQIK